MALVAFSVRIVSAAIAFLSQIILARLMGEFEYGIFVFVWVLVILFGSLLLRRLSLRRHPLPAGVSSVTPWTKSAA